MKSKTKRDRRNFIKTVPMIAGVALLADNFPSLASKKAELKIACQQYTWFTYFKREGKSWMENPEVSLKEFSASGLSGYEPSFNTPEDVVNLHGHMNKQQIWAKSMYVNSVLHEAQLVEKNIQEILAIAKEATKIGIKILVTNPTPIRWGGDENKSDEQLKTQAIALNLLGKKLKEMGISLAYHNHDAELREGAREFHHMLTGTDSTYVKLCLDAHWIYRGTGNSEVALFDIVELYADRIVELHLRQSHDGVWSEVFEEGDIDYARLAKMLKSRKMSPHIVLEQAIENGTPHTMNSVEAMSKSLGNVNKIFYDLL